MAQRSVSAVDCGPTHEVDEGRCRRLKKHFDDHALSSREAVFSADRDRNHVTAGPQCGGQIIRTRSRTLRDYQSPIFF